MSKEKQQQRRGAKRAKREKRDGRPKPMSVREKAASSPRRGDAGISETKKTMRGEAFFLILPRSFKTKQHFFAMRITMHIMAAKEKGGLV